MRPKQFLIIISFILICFIGYGQGLTPYDIAKIKYVGNIDIADDGNKIAYTLIVQSDPLKENKAAHTELHVLDVNTGNTIPFSSQGNVSSVTFRPDKRTITFLDKRDNDQHRSLYEISLGGGEATKILEYKTSITTYQWSPDGNKIAFIAPETDKEKKEKTELPYEPVIYEEDLKYNKGFLYDFNTDQLNNIEIEGHFYNIRWNPNGNMLAVSTAPTPLVDDRYMRQTISIVKLTDFMVTGKVDHEGKLETFEWSPDGSSLAILAGEDIHDPTPGRLFIVSSKGGKPQNLKPDYPGQFEEIIWSDNNTIHFIASKGVWSVMGSVKSDGSGLAQLIDPGGPNLNHFDRSADGTFAYVADSPQHPEEIYLMKEGDKSPRKMTDHNSWLTGIKLGKQEVISYKARDGKEIQGIVIHPINKNEGTKSPMITVVHGGPESHYNNGWITSYSSPGQVGANNGFAVFYPNYRGSTGRGVEFTKSSQGDLAGKEFDDIVDGVDYLIESGIADKDKVGVTGGSYGGYATAWMSTRYTDRFAAGVMFVGISNNLSKWGTSDIPEELYLVHARKRVWEDYDWWLKRSPVYYAGQAKTPLLIMHGEDDTRVYPGQSMELYRHIKTRTDTPVRLVFYPGEGHGNRKSTARLDYSLRMLRWFEHYLKKEDIPLDTEINIEVETEGN